MILPDAEWRHRPGLAPVLDALDAAAGRTRFVGGCVRDTLLGLEVSDIDLATQLSPDEVVRRLAAAGIKAVPTGIKHGTVTAVSAGQPVEVTTLRRDVATDGRRATVAFTEDWREDAARRDFTINALSADPADGTVHDFFGGLADLDARRVRFIGEPYERITEDHLRILRFFRFHARFGEGEPDPESLAACTARANDLMALSRERIASELLRLLALPDPVPTIRLMIAGGIFRPVLPEIDSADRLARLAERERGTDVSPDPIRRLAALLPEDMQAAEEIGHRLRLSTAQRQRLVYAADRAEWPTGSAFQRSYAVGAASATDRLLLGDEPVELAQTLIETFGKGGPPRLPLKGSALIALGLPKSPLVTRTMRRIEDRWVAEDFPGPDRLDAIVGEEVAQALRERQ